ncbi:MAG: radical SAM protein [Planctomycetota bacterium]
MLTGRVPPPKSLIVDPCNVCNLRCPICPTGQGKLELPRGRMSAATFEHVLTAIPSARSVELYNWGEPLLNPEIADLIRLAHSRGVQVHMHTNFSLRVRESLLRDLVTSGLDHLTLSIDGATQTAYERYRRGGEIELVLANIRSLQAAKRSLNSATPAVCWRFIVNRYNIEDVDRAHALASEMGLAFKTVPIGLGAHIGPEDYGAALQARKEEWLPSSERHVYRFYRNESRPPERATICPHLFNSAVINPDGTVLPCCYVDSREAAFGNCMQEDFSAIWNNQMYYSARRRFLPSLAQRPVTSTICQRCLKHVGWRQVLRRARVP